MIVEHLDAYEIALIIWSFLFGLLGLQGLVAIWLEGEVDEVGERPAPPIGWGVLGLAALLVAGEIGLSIRLVGLLFEGSSPEAAGRTMALLALGLALLVMLYRRYAVDDVVVAQDRDDGVPW